MGMVGRFILSWSCLTVHTTTYKRVQYLYTKSPYEESCARGKFSRYKGYKYTTVLFEVVCRWIHTVGMGTNISRYTCICRYIHTDIRTYVHIYNIYIYWYRCWYCSLQVVHEKPSSIRTGNALASIVHNSSSRVIASDCLHYFTIL
jgi:hypothetical protein